MPPYKIDESKIHWGSVRILPAEKNKINEVMNQATKTNLNIFRLIQNLNYRVRPYTARSGWWELYIGEKNRLYFTVDGNTIKYEAIGNLQTG